MPREPPTRVANVIDGRRAKTRVRRGGGKFLPWCDVRDLPTADPGIPDTRSPVRFLLWIARSQWPTLLAGIAFGICWLVAQAVMPWAIGRGIELGVVDGNAGASIRWSLVILGMRPDSQQLRSSRRRPSLQLAHERQVRELRAAVRQPLGYRCREPSSPGKWAPSRCMLLLTTTTRVDGPASS